MKILKLMTVMLFLNMNLLFSQVTILPNENYPLNNDSTVKPVFLYEAGFQYDTLYEVSFTWFSKNNSMKVGKGYLVQAFKMFSREYDIKGRDILVHDEFYVIGTDGIRYYLNGIMIGNIVMDSKRIPQISWFKKLFGGSPRIVWEIKIQEKQPKSN